MTQRTQSPHVEIITIGTELLLGTTLDGNSAYIGRALADIGLDVYAKHSVGDNRQRLRDMLERALDDANGAITTGGLGPTVDDLTKDAIAEVLGVDLVLHEPSLAALEERFERSGRTVSENNRRQVYLPRGAIVLPNPHGTAPGFVGVRSDGRFIAALPGVPREMRPMLGDLLLPWLRTYLHLEGGIVTKTLRTVGIAESEIDRRIEDLFRAQENPKIAVLAHMSRVDIKIMAKVAQITDAPVMIAPLEVMLRDRIGEGIYGVDQETLEERIVTLLKQQALTLGCAESCTGGAIADAIVAVPGASNVFRGGIVAYANDVKERLLGVSRSILERVGAVSSETVCAMAEGALRSCETDFALATSGIAGPDGGTEEKPVGLVWIALAQRSVETQVRRLHLTGDRADIRARAVTASLALLYETLSKRLR